MKLSSDQIVWHRIEDDIYILNMAKGSYYILKEVAAKVWESLLDEEKIETIAHGIYNEYKCGLEEVKQDIIEFVDELRSEDLIV
jgi:hypothetical protein